MSSTSKSDDLEKDKDGVSNEGGESSNNTKDTKDEGEGTSDNLTDSCNAEEPEGDDCSTEEEDEKAGWLEKLQSFFASKLQLEEKEEVPQVLDENSVEGIVSYIKSGKCKKVITMAGAGISTSAGIPDFRSPDSGLYANLSKYDLPYPEAIFNINFFRSNPKPFFVLAKELYPGTFNPTPSHYFIKVLHDKGLLLRHYTQNIDTLEHVAGIPEEKLVEAHGTFRTSHCLVCRKEYSQQWIKDEIFADRVPTCTECGGVVKPDIVFFSESLPTRFFELMSSDFKRCDLLIIMGTSLTVQPFASLVDNVPAWCPRLLINREKVGMCDSGMGPIPSLFRCGGGGLDPDSPTNKRDVCIIGDCDDGCLQLAHKLGWKEEIETLIERNKKK